MHTLTIGPSKFLVARDDDGAMTLTRVQGNFQAKLSILRTGHMEVTGSYSTLEMSTIIAHWRAANA